MRTLCIKPDLRTVDAYILYATGLRESKRLTFFKKTRKKKTPVPYKMYAQPSLNSGILQRVRKSFQKVADIAALAWMQVNCQKNNKVCQKVARN